MTSTTLLGKLRIITSRHPIVRGMLSYAVLWPTSCAIQQIIQGCTLETFDWKRCIRFGIYGSLVVAPTLYGWVRLSTEMWPSTTLKVAVTKALVEQVSYAPFTLSVFYVGMNLLEFKSLSDGFAEMTQKFWPTYKVALCIWPLVQTINFSLVPERNRVVVVSIISVMWTTFLAYMKQLEKEKNDNTLSAPQE